MSSLAYGFERGGLETVDARIKAWFANNPFWMTRTSEPQVAAPVAVEQAVPMISEVHTAASDAEILFAAGIMPRSAAGQLALHEMGYPVPNPTVEGL